LSEVKLRRKSLKLGLEGIEVLFTLMLFSEGYQGSLATVQIGKDALENFKHLISIVEFVQGSGSQTWSQVFGSHAINLILNVAHSKVFVREIISICGQLATHLRLKIYRFSLV
jgi:hypothetical protein